MKDQDQAKAPGHPPDIDDIGTDEPTFIEQHNGPLGSARSFLVITEGLVKSYYTGYGMTVEGVVENELRCYENDEGYGDWDSVVWQGSQILAMILGRPAKKRPPVVKWIGEKDRV